MPTGKITAPTISGLGNRRYVLPVAVASDWSDVCGDPLNVETDSGVLNSGIVVAPNAIVRSAQNWLQLAGIGTTVQIRLRYPLSATITANPVVQAFGRDRTGLPQRLVDSGGLHPQQLSVDLANDVRDATYGYTQPVEVDADGCAEAIVAIRTALAGSGLSGATIQARVK